MKRVLLATLLCVAACTAFGVEDSDSTEPVSAAQAFVTKATQAGLAEIQLGSLMQTRSSDPKVKAFAARMVKDHTRANAELAALAKRKKLEVPTDLDAEHATMVHAVGTKPPSEINAEYAKQMRDSHDAAVTLFQDASAVGDKDLAAFAKKTLPTLREHQQLAATLPAKPKVVPNPETPQGATPPGA
jgi:putative membrane protein